MRTAFNTNEV